MKPSKLKNAEDSGAFKPFEHLKDLLKKHSVKLTEYDQKPDDRRKLPAESDDEAELFANEMSDVVPIADKDRHIPSKPPIVPEPDRSDFDSAIQLRLKELIEEGTGFIVSDTSEYMEGVNHKAHPEILKRLHRGDFTIQGVIDLHGLNVPSAQEAFDNFIKESISRGNRSVMIIHGRGLSSPVRPVLKNAVREWLTSGRFRNWVMAFSSARSCDGGAGATYVLLRKNPLTRRFRKGKS